VNCDRKGISHKFLGITAYLLTLVCHSCNTVSDSTSASGRLEDRIGKEYEGVQSKQYLQSEAT